MYVSRSGLLTFMFIAMCAFLYAAYAIVIEPDYMIADKYHYSGDNVTYYDTTTENYETVDYNFLPSGVKKAYDDFLEREQSGISPTISDDSSRVTFGSEPDRRIDYHEGSDVRDRFELRYDGAIYFTDDAGKRFKIEK